MGRGNAISVFKARAKLVSSFHGKSYYHPAMWDIWCMMFIGMGLLKLGVVSGERSTRYYALCVLVGYGIGICGVQYKTGGDCGGSLSEQANSVTASKDRSGKGSLMASAGTPRSRSS